MVFTYIFKEFSLTVTVALTLHLPGISGILRFKRSLRDISSRRSAISRCNQELFLSLNNLRTQNLLDFLFSNGISVFQGISRIIIESLLRTAMLIF